MDLLTYLLTYLLAAWRVAAWGTAYVFAEYFLLVGWLVGLGAKFLDNGSQPSLNGSPRNLHTRLMWVKP